MTGLYGWTGRILRVDLSTGGVSTTDTMEYACRYVGGLGIAARIAWDELHPGVGPFDPDNPLFVMVGPLTGTMASGAGRVLVAGVAPQQRPPVFSRSGIGGHWGAELKYAGFDGVIVVGKADGPVYLWIHDGAAEIRDASEHWGKGTYATTAALRGAHGAKTRVLACGPAGENLCRIACIQSETGNAAGQGGYGAVMGSKNLKAMAVRGTMGVRVAQPQRLMDVCLHASREGQRPPARERRAGSGEPAPPSQTIRRRKCGFCISECASRLFMGVPGESTPGLHTADWSCYGLSTSSLEAHIEGRELISDLGLNGWEVAYGIIPWLQLCRQHGLIHTIDGIEIPIPDRPIEYYRDVVPVSGQLLTRLVRMIAYRQGELGEALADGACYAAYSLFGGRGVPLLNHIYPRHAGQTSHWNAHWGTGGNIYFPFWLVPILQWCVDTRDPASDCTHGYSTHMLSYLPVHGPNRGPLTLDEARAVCAKVYREPDVPDPAYAYEKPDTKAIPAIFHHDRGMAVESLVLCDKEHSRVFSLESENHAADTGLMANLLSACTGLECDESELDRYGARIFNLLRTIDIRNHGRSRIVDESTAASLTHPSFTDGVTLDLEQFRHMLSRYYELRGWDPVNGWPTRDRLVDLDLSDVASELDTLGRPGVIPDRGTVERPAPNETTGDPG